MVLTKHILIDKKLEDFIKKNKNYDRETPNDILKRLLKLNKNSSLKGGLK